MSIFGKFESVKLNRDEGHTGSGGVKGEVAENRDSSDVAARWNNLGQEVPFGNVGAVKDTEAAKDAEREQKDHERQYRKLVAAIKYDPRFLNTPDVILPNGVMEEFKQELNDGTISEDAQERFLTRILSPAQQLGVSNLNMRLGNDKHMRRILGYAMGSDYGFDAYRDAMGDDYLQNFVNKYPTPLDFEKTRERLLGMVHARNSEQKYQEYVADVDKFQKTIYGKRYEYYQRLNELKGDSKEADDTEYIEEDNGAVAIESYSDAEQEKIISESIIDGDYFNYHGKYYELTTEALKREGLLPKEKIVIGGVEIGISDKFNVGRREAFLGYVKGDDGYKVRSYYRSNSQGLWRYLPDYVMTENGGFSGIAWFGKAYTEEMTTLPSELQSVLSGLAKKEPIQLNTVPEFILGGTAKAYKSRDEYTRTKYQKALRGDLYREVNSLPSVNFGILSPDKDSPESVTVQGMQQPNFNNELMTWESNTAIYGDLSNRVYGSFDKKLKYTFSQDTKGRCFISNIETNGKITSTGVRAEWVSGGDLETPLYEYPGQSDGYGDMNDVRGEYVSMWEHYLSKMKLIKNYLASRNKI